MDSNFIEEEKKIKYIVYLYGEMFSLILKCIGGLILNNQISRIKEMNIFNDSKDMIRTLSHTAWWEWPLAQSLQNQVGSIYQEP